ncbi:outer membrane protein assembly factor BamE [Salinisphaera sp. USBA-960]|uniref:outer membrane protein assembly factor BamE n=1 Tax=Salinisphaera orenii TaxID=856731 RepID=UPI0013A6762C|nr:outer membrane protein assembly factor BamE [Salifodinibacter halophilus]NNC25512.1 outer membrane protein assembly factor BamE [Salifodinibacter halophilus]
MKKTILLLTPLVLAACQGGVPGYYRTPIVQGNTIAPNKVSKLKLGMTRKQVKYLLGTPLVKPKFDADRQNYVFYYRNPRAHENRSKLILYFNQDKLAKVSGNAEFTSQVGDGKNDAAGNGQNQIDS